MRASASKAAPTARKLRQRRAAVQTHRQLHAQPWASTFEAAEETWVQFARNTMQQIHVDRDASRAQQLQATAGDMRIGVLRRNHHSRHASLDQGRRARWRAAVMRAWLERHVHGGTTRPFTRFAQGEYFGVGFAGALMEPGADDLVAMRNHATHAGIRLGSEQPALGQLQRVRHMRMVDGAEGRHETRVTVVSSHAAQHLDTQSGASSGRRLITARRAHLPGSVLAPAARIRVKK